MVPETVFTNFRIATMSLAIKSAYGMLEDHSIGVVEGKIVWILPDDQLKDLFNEDSSDVHVVDGDGLLLTPGLIDCHTHLVHGGNRANEWEMRLNGRGYEEIARAGGGILSSVTATRAASESELFESAATRLRYLMNEGVTTIEIKSGYGLDVDTELKMLRVARKLGSELPIRVETTLLGAHSIPPEFKSNPNDYVDLVCGEMIPAAKEWCTSVDVFCESIAFSLEQTRRVFETALDSELNIKVHAEQLTRMGAAVMAAEMGAISADHLEYLSDSDCEVLSRHETVATLLPGAFYCLNETQKPPVESLRKNKVPIAIATDCNPGSSPVVSLLLMANMACNLFRLTPEEAFAGITRNAANALKLDHQVGTIEVGKVADLVAWAVESPTELVYAIGANPIRRVYFGGLEN